MNAKHTPGPWALDRSGVKVLDPREKSEYVLANVHGASIRELEANARLIAAAPDLLEALEALVGENRPLTSLCIHDGEDAFGRVKGTWSVEAQRKAVAALAKAKGQL